MPVPEVWIQWPGLVEGSLEDSPAAIAVAALMESAFAKSAANHGVSYMGHSGEFNGPGSG